MRIKRFNEMIQEGSFLNFKKALNMDKFYLNKNDMLNKIMDSVLKKYPNLSKKYNYDK